MTGVIARTDYLPGKATTESRSSMIGLINLEVKCAGTRSAGKYGLMYTTVPIAPDYATKLLLVSRVSMKLSRLFATRRYQVTKR